VTKHRQTIAPGCFMRYAAVNPLNAFVNRYDINQTYGVGRVL
jgi:hypothetical protein